MRMIQVSRGDGAILDAGALDQDLRMEAPLMRRRLSAER
jgi:hypothetical protein